MAQASPIRTSEELADIEFNYFIAFKIGLNETDPTKIETKIKTVLSDPKGSTHSRRLLELKNDALEIMCFDAVYNASSGTYKRNAGGRKKEAAEAKKFKLADALEAVTLICQTRKTVLKSELVDIMTAANKPVEYFSEKEFFGELAYLSSQGVKIIDNIDKKIPFYDFQQTDKQLKAVNNDSLYEFLGVSPSCSAKDIQTAIDAKYKEQSRIADLKKKQSYSSLCGTAKKLLMTPDLRKSYDEYLVLRDDVWSEFEKRKSYGIKELQMDEYLAYTQKVVDLLKIKAEAAEEIIAVGCKFFQFTVIGKAKSNDLEVCPYPECGKLYVKGAKSCPHCGKPLEILCWNCKQKKPFSKDDRGCPTCGATQQMHTDYQKICASVDAVFNKVDVEIAELQTALLQIKNIIPNYASRTDSVIYLKVKDYEKTIQERIKQEETVGKQYKQEVAKIKELIAQRKYQSAYSVAKSLTVKFRGYNAASTKKLLDDISAVTTAAQKQLESAKIYMAQGNANMAVSCAVKALELCDDYSDARQILQKYPPQAVQNLRCSVVGGKVKIEWDDPQKQDSTTYTIIKKIGVAPVNGDDGVPVDKGLSVKFFEDASIVSATPYYYAVFAERYGIRSNITATPMPVTVFFDVSNVQQELVTDGIRAVWDAPQNVKSIEVWRNVGPVAPAKPGEGTKISCDGKGFFDGDGKGQNAYLIVCCYQTKSGVVKSKGVRAVFKPYGSITPLKGVSIVPTGINRYTFSCDGGYTGKVSLYYADTRMPVPTDSVLKFMDFGTVCKGMTKIAATQSADGNITFALPPDKIGQVYAIVATDQLFAVSPPKLVNSMSGVNCSYSMSMGTVTIKATLPPKASGMLVKVSQDRFAETPQSGGESFSFKRSEFEQNGKIEIKLKSNTVNYITVFAEFNEFGEKSYSQPFKFDQPIDYREAVSVLYCMDAPVSATKPFKITIRFESEKEVEIPALLLMKGHPKPLNKNAGELCERLDPIKLKKGLLSKKYTGKLVVPVGPMATNTKFAIFFASDITFVQLKQVQNL